MLFSRMIVFYMRVLSKHDGVCNLSGAIRGFLVFFNSIFESFEWSFDFVI